MRLWIFLISSLLLSLASINGSASFFSNTQSLTPLDNLNSLLAGKRQFKLNNPDEFFRHRELLVKDLKPPKERWANCVERFSKPYDWPQEDTEQLKLEIWRCNDLLLSMPDKNGEFLADLTNLFRYGLAGKLQYTFAVLNFSDSSELTQSYKYIPKTIDQGLNLNFVKSFLKKINMKKE